MLILNINGPINSGKTTVGKILAKMLPNAFFIEVGSLMSNSERNILKLTVAEGWREKLKRLDVQMEGLRMSGMYKTVIFAFQSQKKHCERWKDLWDDNYNDFVNITLAPSKEVCLTNRNGKRALVEWEINRINEMYDQGYANPDFADLIINNDNETPEETALKIKEFIDNGCQIIEEKTK